MKAPSKIYLTEGDSIFEMSLERKDKHDIEYTRTDTFIEKACDAYCAICDTKECAGCVECAWVIKFRRQLLKY